MAAKTKLVRERRFPVTIDKEGRHMEDSPNGTLIEFSWRFGPNQSPQEPEMLLQDIVIAVYTHGQIVAKYATAHWNTESRGYRGMSDLYNEKEGAIVLSLSNHLYKVSFPGKRKSRRFGKGVSASCPGTVAIQKFEVS